MIDDRIPPTLPEHNLASNFRIADLRIESLKVVQQIRAVRRRERQVHIVNAFRNPVGIRLADTVSGAKL